MVYKWLFVDHFCLLCGQLTDDRRDLCVPCEAELPWLRGACQRCALPLPAEGLVCGRCLKRPPAFEQVIAPWRYAFPVDALITRFKHQRQWPLGRLLGELLGQHLYHAFDQGLPRPDWLLPVPLSRARQRRRGFNQAQWLADWLAGPLQLPLATDWLLRIRDTPAQQALDAAARRRNLRQAFALSPRAPDLRGRHLALVDDVLTTGATADALARLLRKAGAARVDVYCLARTPAPGDP